MREIFVDTLGNIITFPNVTADIGRVVTGTMLAESVDGERVLIYRLGGELTVPAGASNALSAVTVQL